MKKGSALLSLVIGMLIASIVFTVLINSLNQFISIDTILNNSIDQTKRFVIATQQMEKDIMGASSTHQAARNTKKNNKKDNPKNATKTDKTAQKKEDEKKPLAECFLLKGTPTEQIIMSFITTNGKESSWPKQTLNNTSFLKRVTYSIEKDPINKKSFRLMRYESPDLAFVKPQKSIVLLDHIHSMSILASYKVYSKEKKNQPKDSTQKEPAKKQTQVAVLFKTTSQWNDSFVYEQDDEIVSRIPDTFIITYELFDNQYKKTSHHAQTITMISDGFYESTRKSNQTRQSPIPPEDEKEESAKTNFDPNKNPKSRTQNSHNNQSTKTASNQQSFPSFLNNGFFGSPSQQKR